MANVTMIKGFLASNIFFGAIGAYANGQDLDAPTFHGSYQAVIELNAQNFSHKNYALSSENVTNTKIISLMYLTPSPAMVERAEKMERQINAGLLAENDFSKGIKSFKHSKSAVDLGMNGVPVLDQGQYGTCVTFASTAILDALLGKGDFIDQQCSLAHNLYLGNNYWDGAYYASEIIDPLQQHGIVQKNKCIETYPAPKLKIETKLYKDLIDAKVNVAHVKMELFKSLTLDNVRQAIDKGHRVALGFQLKANSDPVSVQGFDVTVDGKKYKGGLWACKQAGSTKNYCGYAMAGHEVVIVGYDDEQKLLKIRNSWGASAAHEGEFYMTYEFLNAMSINGTEVWFDEDQPVNPVDPVRPVDPADPVNPVEPDDSNDNNKNDDNDDSWDWIWDLLKK